MSTPVLALDHSTGIWRCADAGGRHGFGKDQDEAYADYCDAVMGARRAFDPNQIERYLIKDGLPWACAQIRVGGSRAWICPNCKAQFYQLQRTCHGCRINIESYGPTQAEAKATARGLLRSMGWHQS